MSASKRATTSDFLVATPIPCHTAHPLPGVPKSSSPSFFLGFLIAQLQREN